MPNTMPTLHTAVLLSVATRKSQTHAKRLKRQRNSHLVSIARSNPTAFQAVRFERPVRPSDNGEDGGIPTKGARGRRFEVSPDLVYEISLQDADRKDGRACAT